MMRDRIHSSSWWCCAVVPSLGHTVLVQLDSLVLFQEMA